MSFKLKISILASLIILTFSGCGTAAVYNVPNQPIVANNTERAVENKDVYKAILRAGAGLGWNVKKIKPGIAEATLYLRTHVAIVTIKYNTTDYSITYKTSTNLNYDESDKTIHTNYNGWIQNLDRAIKTQLTLI